MTTNTTAADKRSGSTDAANNDESIPQWADPAVITRSDGSTVTCNDHQICDPVVKLWARIDERPAKIPLENVQRIDPLPRGEL